MLNIVGGNTSLGYNNEKEDDGFMTRVAKRVLEGAKSYLPPLSMGRYGINLGSQAIADISGADIAPKDYNKDDLGYSGILARGIGIRRFNQEKELKKEVRKVKKEYQSLIPTDINTLKDDEKIAKAKQKNEKIARMDKNERNERLKKLKLEFDIISKQAQKRKINLDIDLQNKDKKSLFDKLDFDMAKKIKSPFER